MLLNHLDAGSIMAKIILSEPDGPYKATIDAEAMTVELRDVFMGVGFTTQDGERLGVSMRDSGFEVIYNGKVYRFMNGVLVVTSGIVLDRT